MTRDDIRAGLRLSMVEMIRCGTVGFLDMYLWDGGLLADVHAAGMRVQAAPAVFGYDAVGYPAATSQTGAQVLDGTAALAAEFTGDELISVAYGPHAPYSCGPDLLIDVAAPCRRGRPGRCTSTCRRRQPKCGTAWTVTVPLRSHWPAASACSAAGPTSHTPSTPSRGTSAFSRPRM